MKPFLLLIFGCLLASGIYAQTTEYVLAGTVYGKKAGRPEKDVYIAAYRVASIEDGQVQYAVPSSKHVLFTSYDGKFELILDATEEYIVEFAKEGFAVETLTFSKKEGVAGKRVGIEVSLKDGSCIMFSEQYVDAQTKKPLAGVRATMSIEGDDYVRIALTDKYGKCFFTFDKPYEVVSLKAYKSGYFFEEAEKINISESSSKNIRSKEMKPIQIGQWIKMEEFAFGINEAQLQTSALAELDQLYELMNDNKGLRVEVASHTDARGDDAYNLELSQSRAEEAVKYLREKGIHPSRLRAKGYGETKLLNKCGNGVRCDNAKHSANRRMEYMVYEIVE